MSISSMTFLNWTFVKAKTACLNLSENTPLMTYPNKVSYYPLIAMDLAFLFFFLYFCIRKTYERILHLFVHIWVYMYIISLCVYTYEEYFCV